MNSHDDHLSDLIINSILQQFKNVTTNFLFEIT